MAFIEDVKMAMRLSTDAYDDEIELLIEASKLDLGIAGVEMPENHDALIKKAIITYCKKEFGSPNDFDRLQKSYDEQKGQLRIATGYTVWR